jgi:hypothetical protein
MGFKSVFNPLNAESNPICHLLALLGAHHILHVSRIRVKGLSESASMLLYTYIACLIYYFQFYSVFLLIFLRMETYLVLVRDFHDERLATVLFIE